MADSTIEYSGVAILVADSDVLVRHGISDYLRHCGYSVIEAATSDEAKAVLEHGDADVAAVLCDIDIKGSLNAFQLRHWIREHDGMLKTILAGNLVGAAEAAADLCEEGPQLGRPYDPQGVVDYIRRLLATRERQER